jgi:hypothetical protein
MATSQAQLQEGTQLKFNGEAGADVAFSMENIATGAGRVSAQYDLTAAPRDWQFQWAAELLMQATPTQYKTIDFYAAGAPGFDNTMIMGDVGVSDAALGDVDQLRNLFFLGSVVIEEADTTKMVGGGWFEWPFRYISIVGYNNGTGAAINATDSSFLFYLIPYNIQGQAT